jgi:hypothetical protein
MAKVDGLGAISKKGALLAILALLALALVAAQPRPAQAAANENVQGTGSTSDFLCATGIPTVQANIIFQASKSKGFVSGFFEVFGPTVFKGFTLSGGSFNKNHYSLTGILGDAFCNGPVGTPAQVTLTGDCGSAVIIHYTDSRGERGDFLGSVACT